MIVSALVWAIVVPFWILYEELPREARMAWREFKEVWREPCG